MQTRKSKSGSYWYAEFPELAEELPTIFKEVGNVVWSINPELDNPAIIDMQIHLNSPIKIGGNPITMPISSDKIQLITGYLKVNFKTKPKEGDTTLHCRLYLGLPYFKEDEPKTIQNIRNYLEELVQKMKGRWDFM